MSRPAQRTAIILAAGHGTRMKSQTPKVLHTLAGKPMLAYPVEAALSGGAQRVVVVVGHGSEAVQAMLAERFDDRVSTALQAEQRGTGDAARCGVAAVPEAEGTLVIFYGDAPLLTGGALRSLMDTFEQSPGPLALLTAQQTDATGYGRILRNEHGQVQGIREQRDCSEQEARITEWNPGVYAVEAGFFRQAIGDLTSDNAQGELYLTDLVALAAKAGGAAGLPWDVSQLHGVNSRADLVRRERDLRMRIIEEHLGAGVTIRDPDSTTIDADVEIAPDTTLERNVQLRGRCRIGSQVHIDVGCVLTDMAIAEGAQLLPYTVATESRIGEGARVGPFSHLRPGSDIGPEARIGNFTETKQTKLGRGSKANHLAYLGNGEIGEGVNVGAGTIFCNYDGFNKHTTVLEDGAFIGSDSQMVAPVKVGKRAYVGSGTTVTQDVPEDALAIGRAKQANKPGLGKRLRERLAAEKARRSKG